MMRFHSTGSATLVHTVDNYRLSEPAALRVPLVRVSHLHIVADVDYNTEFFLGFHSFPFIRFVGLYVRTTKYFFKFARPMTYNFFVGGFVCLRDKSHVENKIPVRKQNLIKIKLEEIKIY
jgi:hypothetical protein